MTVIRTASSPQGKAYKAHLLCLPPEIRQQIYFHASALARYDHLNLLYTCKLIYEEALLSFQSRPLVFSCQEQLISTLSRIRQPHLSNVSRLKLALSDLDPNLIEPSLSHVVTTSSAKISLNPYQMEVKHITSALSWLRRLESVTLMRQSNPGRRQCPRDLSDGVVSWLNRSMPKLKQLCIQVDNYQLSHVANLQYLRRLQVSGFSESTPEETRDAFRGLSKLHTLNVVPAGYIMREPYFRCREPLQSITPEVIANLRPLQSLTLIDPPETAVDESPYLTQEMFDAIRITHSKSLKILTISSLHALPPASTAALSTLLQSASQVRYLSLAVPGVCTNLLLRNSLPRSVRTIDVLPDNLRETDDLVKSLAGQKGDLPDLHTVTCLVSAGRSDQDLSHLPTVPTEETRVDHVTNDKPPFAVKWQIWRSFEDNIET